MPTHRVAAICVALLALLLLGLAAAVALSRFVRGRTYGHEDDPTHWFTRLVRAHGNTSESAPILAILILLVAHSTRAGPWVAWGFVAATAGRYLHSFALAFYPTLARSNVFRFVGTTVWMAAGGLLGLVVLLSG